MKTDGIHYISPAFRDHPLAAEWGEFLAGRLAWDLDDFGGGYPWDTDIPPRDQWEEEVERFNEHLRGL
jgi:hypothetical protein